MRGLTIMLVLGCIAAPVLATDSVVLGRGVKNEYFDKIQCPPDELCMDSLYVWEIDANQTLAGPKVTGRVRAVISVHGLAISKYVKSVELFVLRPIEKPDSNGSKFPAFSLLALSPRYKGRKYCLAVDPITVGLAVDSTLTRDGMYCFARAQLLRPNTSLERTRDR